MSEEEQFFAWLDGELKGEEAKKVAKRVAASPELTAEAARHRTLAAGLRDAFEPVLEAASNPPQFQSGHVIDFGARATARERRRGRFGAPQWAAMAASLAIGVVVGTQFQGRTDRDPVTASGVQLLAANALDQALDQRLASAPVGEGYRIGLTFRDHSGKICRSFSDAVTSGLACREGEQWEIRGLFQAGEGQGAAYRMAAGDDPRLAGLVDEAIAGEPFDAGQEKAALKRGWR